MNKERGIVECTNEMSDSLHILYMGDGESKNKGLYIGL